MPTATAPAPDIAEQIHEMGYEDRQSLATLLLSTVAARAIGRPNSSETKLLRQVMATLQEIKDEQIANPAPDSDHD
jgi:hypothetical protein